MKILDFGCGDGYLAQLLMPLIPDGRRKNGFLETGITQDMDDYTVVVAERNII